MPDVPDTRRTRKQAAERAQEAAERAAATARAAREHEMGEHRRAADKQLADADDALQQKADAADQARAKANLAYHAVQSFSRQFELRADHVHRGVDTATARASAAMHHRLLGLRKRLAHSDALIELSDLQNLASLFVVAQPEFAAKLHELVDAEVPKGHPPLCHVTDEEIAAGKAELRAASNEAAALAAAADAEHTEAARIRNAIELGRPPRHR